MSDLHRQAQLWVYDAANSLVNDTHKQAAEALHEVYKIFHTLGYTEYQFLQARELAVRLAEQEADITYLENPDGSRTSMMRDKLLKAEMELGKESITVH